MAKQRFLNNFTSTFIASVKDAPSSGTPETELDYGVLRISDGAAGSLINPTDGDYYLLTAFKRSGSVESNIEVMRVTGVNNATPGECRITVQRAQEGTSAKAFVAGDYLSLRITKGTAENFSQPADLATKEQVIAAPGSAPTEKYWRGDKTWRDFFTDVRAATLTGLSTATNTVVAATDTVLAAIGKLQAQVSAKADSANVRERLTTPRTYYVRIDGSDSNTGLVDSAGGAFLTLQKALTTIGNLDLGAYDVTVQLGAGTYNASSVVSATVGLGRVIIVGNTSNPSSVILTSSGGVLSFSRGLYRVSGVTLSSTSASIVNSLIGADVEIGNVRFGGTGTFGAHMYADGGMIRTIADYEIFGGAWFHARAVSGGAVRSEIAITVTLTGVPAFTGAFVRGQTLGLCAYYGATFVGTATGARYDASANGVVFSNGAGATYYPGNVAGTVGTGGQYL